MSQTKPAKITVPVVRAMKNVTPIGMITAYDYPSARIADEAGADVLLVGDSLGMVVLGYPDTLSVTVGDMAHHTRAAARGTRRALLVADMPYLSYHISREETLRNAGALIQAGAHAVKLEGGKPSRIEMVTALVDAEIPVMGHIGLTPQSVNALGGFKLQGKGADEARRLLDEALALESAGCFSIVMECVPAELAQYVTSRLSIPTIGIGAGPWCDGQVLVFHDLLGIYDGHKPKFVRRYAHEAENMKLAIGRYLDEVRSHEFPNAESESFHTSGGEDLQKLYGQVIPLVKAQG